MSLFKTIHQLIILALVLATQVQYHATLSDPSPRPGSNGPEGIGIKLASPGDRRFFNTCGNITRRGTPVKTVQSGTPLSVSWVLHRSHPSAPGVFISLRCGNDRSFRRLASGLEITSLRTSVNIPSNVSGNCELQFRWTTSSDVAGASASYIACSDIAVQGGGSNGGRGGSNGNRSPSNTPTGSNLQQFTGALFNIPAPQVFRTARGFDLMSNGRVIQSFSSSASALRESCRNQNDACRKSTQGRANDGRAQCDRQLTQCRALAR